jgi:hypothetical protein
VDWLELDQDRDTDRFLDGNKHSGAMKCGELLD